MRKPVVALVAVVVILCGLFGFNLWHAMRGADRVALERTSKAVNAALTDQLKRIESLTDDNAFWDDSFRALAEPRVDEQFMWDTFGSVTSGELYDHVFALNDQGGLIFAQADMKPDRRANAFVQSPGLIQLRQRLRGARVRTGGIVKVAGGFHIVGLAVVRPNSKALIAQAAGQPRRYLGFSKRIDATFLKDMGAALALEGLSLKSNRLSANRPSNISKSDTIVVKTQGGEGLALIWTPFIPGKDAVIQSLPLMGAGLFVSFLAIVLLSRFTIRAVEDLNQLALVDSLSLLPNRRALKRHMDERIERGEVLALAFIDLDGFKAVNDNYGHAVGDSLIRECAAIAKAASSSAHFVARLGGDEFAILAHGSASLHALERTVDRFLTRLGKPLRLGERSILIGASVGLAVPTDDCDAIELMRRADMAMYVSKSAGKMRTTLFDPAFDLKQAADHALEQKIRAALDEGGFSVFYQPVVASGTGALTGTIIAVEALARWFGAGGQETLPDTFIPVAEETGLIDRLGEFVLHRACSEIAPKGSLGLSVNISAAQLRNPEFPLRLHQILLATQFPLERLELEVTETYLIGDPAMAKEVLDQIRALGVRIALDDFGSGYASIGFLRQFRFDTLKLDRSLTADAVVDEVSRSLLQASVALARALDMKIVAEGIETQDQADMMRVIGCDQLQGWHFAAAGTLDQLRINEVQGATQGIIA